MVLTPLNLSTTLSFLSVSFWRVLVSALVLIVGWLVARSLTRWIRRMARQLSQQSIIKDSPLASLVDSSHVLSGSGAFSAVVFWMIMLLFLAIAGEALGILLFTELVSVIVGFLPRVLSAAIVLVLGVVLAGVLETLSKRQYKRYAPEQAVLVGTMVGYTTLGLFVLIAISELGIASQFILVLFAGFVLMIALAAGLAFGLGAKGVVANALEQMVQREKTDRSSK